MDDWLDYADQQVDVYASAICLQLAQAVSRDEDKLGHLWSRLET